MKQISKGFIRTSFSLAALFAGASAATAQTSGNLTGTGATLTYSTAPFNITSGPGTYPDGGGALTLNPVTGSTPGVVGANTTLNFDVSPTLSSIVFNTPIQYGLATAAGQSIVASAGGLTLNTVSTAQNVNLNGVPISIAFGSQIPGSISGGGAAGLTKTGSGQVFLLGASTYTGGTHFNGGFTTLGGTAAVGDSVLGAAGAGNGLSFNGGSVLFNTTGGLTSARDIFIDAGGGSLLTNTATTLNGVISGAGTLNNLGFGGTALTLQGANTFTGAFVARGTGSNTTLGGNGSLASAASYDLVGTVSLNNAGINVTDRLSDTAAITLRGGYFISTGNASASSSETVGAVTGVNGVSTILVTPGAGQANSLTVASLTRQNRSTFVFRGAALGSAPGAGVANIYSTASPAAALIGGGGGAGTTGISILPFAIGNSSSSVVLTATGQVGSSFVTYDANGIRPLATTEYATAFGINNTDNVRLTAAAAAGANVTANALLFAPGAAATLSGGPINVTSGAFLYSPTANVTGTVSAPLNFGAAEGVVTNTSTLTMSGVLSGANGLTLNTTFSLSSSFTPTLTLSGANTYSGNTTITSGGIGFSGTIDNGVAGPFGVSGAIVLNGGNNNASLVPNAATTINRNLSVIGFGQDFLAPSAAGTITVNGNVSLSNNLNVYGNTNVASDAVTFNGVISGTGSIRDLGTTYGVFNGNNTYSGGTVLASSTYYAGSDTAFGPGTFTFNGAGTLAGVGATARTLANNVLINGVNATFGGAAPLTFTGGVSLNGTSTITVTNTALTSFNGVVSNGSLTKTGVGALAFNSPTGNTFTGGFVNTGLAATASAIYANNASGSAFGTGAVSVGGASQTVFSTLAGNFTTSGATSIGGRLSPGNGTGLTPATAGIGSIGTANFGNGLTLTSTAASSLYLEIGSSTSRDAINVAGTITLAGTVYFATTGGYVVQSGNTFDFVDATAFAGTPTFNTTGVTFASGVSFDTSRFAIDGTVIAVPEPGTVSLLGAACAMVGAAVLRRRRR